MDEDDRLVAARREWAAEHPYLLDTKLAFTAGWMSRDGIVDTAAAEQVSRLTQQLELAAGDIVFARINAHLAAHPPAGSSVGDRAAALVKALHAALPGGALHADALDVLLQVFTAAYALVEIPFAGTALSVYEYAGVLLGSRGDADGRDLAEAVRAEAAEPIADMAFIAADRALAMLYVELDADARAAATAVPRLIVAQLAAAADRWEPPVR